MRKRVVGAVVTSFVCVIPSALALDDWDLYMLKLVNRARQDPAGEPARIGSAVTDPSLPRPPLAYESAVGAAATNHNNWMHDNFGSIASFDPPDSFTHFETLNGQSGGTPATGTPSYTGAGLGTRITAAGFSWDFAGENITATWSTAALPVDQAQIDDNHFGWWESANHRSNMLSLNYTVFGHHAESRAFAPPRGGIDPPFDNLHYATQDYARPIAAATKTCILGLIYKDLNGNGVWTPRNIGDPQREGLGDLPYAVFTAGTTTFLTGGTSLSNGAFSINRGNGSYDIQFTSVPGTPTGKLRIENVTVTGQNVDSGDQNTLSIAPADFNGDQHVDGDDFDTFKACATRANVPYDTGLLPPGCLQPFGSAYVAPDFDHDQDVDPQDYAIFQNCYSGTLTASAACAN